MGKARKGRKNQNNKLQRPGRNEKHDEKVKNEKILPLIAKLKSADFRDRVVAISAINSMIDDPNYRTLLLKEKLLQVILSHSLSDQSQEIVAEGFGLLRNIVIEEGRDSAVYLYRQNILATIKATIEKLNKVWQETENLSTLQGQDKVIVREFTENIFGLACGIAMADDEIYDAVVQLIEPLAPFITQLLQSKFGLVHDVVLEFLYVMSEDEQAVSVVVNSGLQTIINDITPENVASQIYKLGIQYNLIEITHNGNETDLAKVMEAIFNTIQTFDFSVVVPPTPEIADEPKKLKNAVLEQARIRSQINASQVAFEIWASIMVSSGHLQSPSQEYLEYIGEKIVPICISALKYPNYTLRAASTLNNIGWTFNVLELEWNPIAERCWNVVAPLIFETNDVNLLASFIGILGAVGQLYGGQVPFVASDFQRFSDRLVELRPAEINLAFEDTKEFCHLLKLWLPFISRVGALPANLEVCALAASSVGSILETPGVYGPELCSESINALFELFGDNSNPNNQIYIDRSINATLKKLRPEYKRVLKSVDKKNELLREQCDETLLNLDRFTAYKDSQEP